MTRRLIAVFVLAATALAGCSSSSSSSSSPSSSSSSPPSTQASGPGGNSSAPTTATGASALANQVGAALNALRSVHLDVDAGGLGGKSTADLMLKDGHATATDAHLTENGQQVEMVTVGGQSYVKLPGASARRPWVEIGSDSTNPMINSLTSGLNIAAMASSLDVVTALMKGATGLQNKGADTVGGVSATHYVMNLDPAKKTGNSQLDGLLTSLGKGMIPLEFWLDSSFRPVKFVIHASFAGTSFPVTVQASKFDAPLSISAPPASEVISK